MEKLTRQEHNKQRREHWQSHIKAWQASGVTRKVYCQQHDLNVGTFSYWRHRLKKASNTIHLVQLPTVSKSQPQHFSLRLVVNDQVAIEVSDGFNPTTLSRVIDVVRSL